jgi:hypothetical protein
MFCLSASADLFQRRLCTRDDLLNLTLVRTRLFIFTDFFFAAPMTDPPPDVNRFRNLGLILLLRTAGLGAATTGTILRIFFMNVSGLHPFGFLCFQSSAHA